MARGAPERGEIELRRKLDQRVRFELEEVLVPNETNDEIDC